METPRAGESIRRQLSVGCNGLPLPVEPSRGIDAVAALIVEQCLMVGFTCPRGRPGGLSGVGSLSIGLMMVLMQKICGRARMRKVEAILTR